MNYQEIARIKAEDDARDDALAQGSTASLAAVAAEIDEILSRWQAEDDKRQK